MLYGNKDFKPYAPLFPTPSDIPLETTCVTINLPKSPAFIGLWIGVMLQLINAENFVQFNDGISRETTAEIFENSLFDSLTESESACEIVPSPYWDNETDNEISEPETIQTWYGQVTDWLAPVDELNFEQNFALWALTGFVAYAAGIGSAIFFRTTAKQFIIAIEAGDIPELIRIVVDSAEFNIDTTNQTGIINVPVLAGDGEHDIYVIKGEL